MAQDRHSEEYKKHDICVRTPCHSAPAHTGQANYITVCDPGWGGSWKFAQRVQGGKAGLRNYEAHHIICWSPAAEILLDDKVIEVIKATKWCVNNKDNMIGMPLWGHTVQWYASNDGAPPFANLPQHDRDHNCAGGYTAELKGELNALVNNIKEERDEHSLTDPQDISGNLTTLSGTFRGHLHTRGSTRPGTHAAFLTGETNPLWYMPFSMANDGIAMSRPRKFVDVLKRKREAIAAAAKLL